MCDYLGNQLLLKSNDQCLCGERVNADVIKIEDKIAIHIYML